MKIINTKKIKSYTIFQKPMLAIHHATNFCNVSTVIGFDKIVDEKLFLHLIQVLVKNFADLKSCYCIDGIHPIQSTDEDFIKNKIRIVHGYDDDELLFIQQNSKLRIEEGNTFFATLNHQSNRSSIILSISHVVADGQTLQIIVYLTILLVRSKKIRLAQFLILLKIHNSKWINKQLPYMSSCYFLSNKENAYRNIQNNQSVITVDVEIQLKSSMPNIGTDVSTAAIMAMKMLYPDEIKIELKRPIGLRNRIKGLKTLSLGEYHVSGSVICDVRDDIGFDELRSYIKKSATVDEKIKACYESLYMLSNNLTEAYEKLINNLNQYCTISVSSFGHFPNIFENIYSKGTTAHLTGNKAYFSILCGIIDGKLKLGISYNPHKIKHNQAALFSINMLYLLKMDVNEEHLYKLFESSYYE